MGQESGHVHSPGPFLASETQGRVISRERPGSHKAIFLSLPRREASGKAGRPAHVAGYLASHLNQSLNLCQAGSLVPRAFMYRFFLS